MTGAQYERDLVNAFESCGWRALRAPGSGGVTQRDSPDVLAGKAHPQTTSNGDPLSRAIAIELKSTSSTTAYVTSEEVTALERFAIDFGAEPRLAVKFKGTGTRTAFWLVEPTEARIVEGSGRHGLPEDTIEDRADMVILPATKTMEAEIRQL